MRTRPPNPGKFTADHGGFGLFGDFSAPPLVRAEKSLPISQDLRIFSDNGNNEEESPMTEKKILYFMIIALILSASCLWAGDTASFVDLGFSPDGRTYMFGQYGVQAKTLKPWADLFVVDVPQNNFVPNGRISYIHDSSVAAGQDGSGALYRLISRNTTLTDRYAINFLLQGQSLYVSVDNGNKPLSEETIEFRDFESGASYKASLVSLTEGTGADLKSSFYINLERNSREGVKKSYIVGTPQLKRSLITSYSIKKVMIAPRDGSIIFVIETMKQGSDGIDIRYMVEALRL
jgi:predicted secreted protein